MARALTRDCQAYLDKIMGRWGKRHGAELREKWLASAGPLADEIVGALDDNDFTMLNELQDTFEVSEHDLKWLLYSGALQEAGSRVGVQVAGLERLGTGELLGLRIELYD